MLFVLMLGLACIFASSHIMAAAGLDARLGDESCLVWFFRLPSCNETEHPPMENALQISD